MTQPKVLIVDDEPFNVDYLEQELEDSNYNILSASNGGEALEKIKSEHPDLVLLDIMMPEQDGSEVAAALKADPITRGVPIIFLTALVSSEDATKGGAACNSGGNTFLPKHIRLDKLMHCIDEKISHKQAALVH